MNSKAGKICTAGGIAGEQRYGNITESWSKGNISNINTGQNAYAGGITGFLSAGAGSIDDCYSLGDITATYKASGGAWVMAGGILGTTSGNTSTMKIQHCYAAGTVRAIHDSPSTYTGNIISGGIAGEFNTTTSTNLTYNIFLGSAVIGRGPGNRSIRFLYAYGPSASSSYTGYRRSDAVKQYSTSATGALNTDSTTNNLDGTSANTATISAGWSDWGFGSTKWGSPTGTFQRPRLINNPET
jgi:hypothetical protein